MKSGIPLAQKLEAGASIPQDMCQTEWPALSIPAPPQWDSRNVARWVEDVQAWEIIVRISYGRMPAYDVVLLQFLKLCNRNNDPLFRDFLKIHGHTHSFHDLMKRIVGTFGSISANEAQEAHDSLINFTVAENATLRQTWEKYKVLVSKAEQLSNCPPPRTLAHRLLYALELCPRYSQLIRQLRFQHRGSLISWETLCNEMEVLAYTWYDYSENNLKSSSKVQADKTHTRSSHNSGDKRNTIPNECYRCGGKHKSGEACPAKDAICSNCKKSRTLLKSM